MLAEAARLLSDTSNVSTLNNSTGYFSTRPNSISAEPGFISSISRSASPTVLEKFDGKRQPISRRGSPDGSIKENVRPLSRKEPSLAIEAALNAAKLKGCVDQTVSRVSSPLSSANEGNSGLDRSISPSLASPPSQFQEQVKMTNMYVERIFSSFRNKRQLPASSVATKRKK